MINLSCSKVLEKYDQHKECGKSIVLESQGKTIQRSLKILLNKNNQDLKVSVRMSELIKGSMVEISRDNRDEDWEKEDQFMIGNLKQMVVSTVRVMNHCDNDSWN